MKFWQNWTSNKIKYFPLTLLGHLRLKKRH